KMEKINSTTISQYKNRLLSVAKLSPSSVNRKLSSMRLYCQWAKGEGYLSQNPFDGANLLNEGYSQELEPEIPIEEFFAKQHYSQFPPARLVQKIGGSIDKTLITFVVAPLTG